MIIAVNTRISGKWQTEDQLNFLFDMLNCLTEKFIEHQFIYIFDKPYDKNQVFAKNVTPLISGPETNTGLRLQFWFNYKIPAILRKYKVDVFVSMDGICSLRTKKPQCLLVSDLSFIQQPPFIKASQARFFKKYFPLFLAKASSLVTVSAQARSVLTEKYRLDKDRIGIISGCIGASFKAFDQDEKESVKATYTNGKDYFLFSGNITPKSNIINLLKAFSFFKIRQKSNMLLLIAGRPDILLKQKLKSYKYRHEVIVLENLSATEFAKIMAAAYSLVYPVLYADFAWSPLQAMQCAVPVITTKTGSLPSQYKNAALYADPNDFKGIAEHMMLVYKDEKMTKTLVSAGQKLLEQYQQEKSAELFMRSILKALND